MSMNRKTMRHQLKIPKALQIRVMFQRGKQLSGFYSEIATTNPSLGQDVLLSFSEQNWYCIFLKPFHFESIFDLQKYCQVSRVPYTHPSPW